MKQYILSVNHTPSMEKHFNLLTKYNPNAAILLSYLGHLIEPNSYNRVACSIEQMADFLDLTHDRESTVMDCLHILQDFDFIRLPKSGNFIGALAINANYMYLCNMSDMTCVDNYKLLPKWPCGDEDEEI